jgi:hypothetical protein
LIRLPSAYHWDAYQPPPRLGLRLSNRRPIRVPDAPTNIDTGPASSPFDLTKALHWLCEDVVSRTLELHHIDLSRVAFSIIKARNGRGHGLQARITPLRFQNGAMVTRHRGTLYQTQRFTYNGRELLYIVTFVMPRFMNRDFEDRLVTIFHELYHISPSFDGDLRRHAGRYCAHTHSKKGYDEQMTRLVREYLKNGADLARSAFLKLTFAQLCRRHGTVVGLHLPRPKLIPIMPQPQPARHGSPFPDTRR